MATVNNTSPLLNLSIIGKLHLIQDQMGEVVIPPAVLEELRLEEGRSGAPALRQAVDDGWLIVKTPSDDPLIRTLRQDLDEGEAAAIALAVEIGAGQVLIDERDGRRRARRLDLDVTGVLGLLLRADRTGHIASLPKTLDRLEEEAGFWISSSLRNQILPDRE